MLRVALQKQVIKVEPPSGDSFRYTMANAVGREMPNDYLNSPAFYAINRGNVMYGATLPNFSSILVCAANQRAFARTERMVHCEQPD